MAKLEHFRFSSGTLDEEEAFGQYVRLYAHGSDVTRGEGPFYADMRGWRLDRVLLFERRLTGAVHARTQRVAMDSYDHLVITAVLEGKLIGSRESGFSVVGPNEIVLADTAQPSRTEPRGAHLLTVSVARDIAEAALGAIAPLHGHILKAPANLMLLDYMRALARHGDQLHAAALPKLTRAFLDVLSSAGDAAFLASGEARRQDVLRRQQVERYIAGRLGDRALSVEGVAAGTGLSRSALYRLFESEGGVARVIHQRRLDAVRRALDDRDTSSVRELAQRCGFANAESLERQFTERYARALADYRAAALAARRKTRRRAAGGSAGWAVS